MKTRKRLKAENAVLRATLTQVITEAEALVQRFGDHDRELHARIDELERRAGLPLDDNRGRGQYL